MRAHIVFKQNDGDVTKAYYAEMNARGPEGQIAVALFRCQKRSTAAKKYRRGKFTRSAYDVKNWSMGELCRLLAVHAGSLGISWGWKRDKAAINFENVLYVDLPTGQCSFHSPDRLGGPDYPGEWNGRRDSAEVILQYCDDVTTRDNLRDNLIAS